jgi:transposase-like protein
MPDAVLDRLPAGADPGAALDPGGPLDGLGKGFAERALDAGRDHRPAGDGGAGSSRDGHGREGAPTEAGRIGLEVPRGRRATLDPRLSARYRRRFPASTTRSSRCTRAA